MTGITRNSSRRSFFLQGGAALGAGVATTVGASALASANGASAEEQLLRLREQLDRADDREAIRQLHLAYMGLIEQRRYEAAAELFDERAQLDLSGVRASGRPGILQLFAEQYRRQQATAIHGAYRPNASREKDAVTFSADCLRASATHHVDVQLSTPIEGDCTAAQMARLQGQMADHHWETGRLEATYVKAGARWKIASLTYLAT